MRPPALALACALALLAPAGAQAATFTVSNAGDGGAGSLRQAISDSNSNGDGEIDDIVFGAPHSIEVIGPELPTIATRVRIDGAGGRVSGGSSALLRISSGTSPVEITRLGVASGIVYGDSADTIASPSGLGAHRLSDGTLRVTGSLPLAGRLELFGASGGTFLERISPDLGAGAFSIVPASLPEGTALTATLTNAGRTSQFATPITVSDLTSPTVTAVRTLDQDRDGRLDGLRVTLSEPVRDASGFGGLAVAVGGATVAGAPTTGAAPDDNEFDVPLAPGTAGDTSGAPTFQLTGNGSLADAAGNQVLVMGSALTAGDGLAPVIVSAAAISRTEVRVRFSEAVVAGSLEPGDFRLAMGEEDRPVTAVRVAADARTAILESGAPWRPGTAGRVTLAGAVADGAGNAAASPLAVRVYAAPGDFVAPSISRARFDRRTFCVRGAGRRCSRPGATVSFTLDEAARITASVRRKAARAVSRVRIDGEEGVNELRLVRKVEGRILRPGHYTIELVATDDAGNASRRVTLAFRVRR